ncbi:hypothetical protein HD554DRAFT_1173387 [Boletus coccyginus]|nr:hypothetical protein HD554DRAFT_1173387 [Boletus coccyginus]
MLIGTRCEHTSQSGPSTTVFRSASNGDPRKIRKIDKIKQKLVEMLRETGFKLSNGVVRDRDKGVSGLSAEDADKLHDALFIDEQRLQFVPRGDESAYDNEGVPSLEVGSGSDCPRESDHLTKGKQACISYYFYFLDKDCGHGSMDIHACSAIRLVPNDEVVLFDGDRMTDG